MIEENQDKIEIQKMYLFSIVLLGLLKHEEEKQEKKMVRSLSSSKIKTSNSVVKEKPLILPQFDLKKYNYSPKIYQFIKINFTIFNDNRNKYLVEMKKRQNEEKLANLKEKPSFKPVIYNENKPTNNSKVT